jgi:hypothetical protein
MTTSVVQPPERDPALAAMTDCDVLRSFREALVAVYPILQRLHCLEDDTQPYDDFDSVAEVLWEVLVLNTFLWRDGLPGLPQLPPYGFFQAPVGADGYIAVHAPGLTPFRFIRFIGDRSFGAEAFNAIDGVAPEGTTVVCPFSSDVRFSWSRSAAGAA